MQQLENPQIYIMFHGTDNFTPFIGDDVKKLGVGSKNITLVRISSQNNSRNPNLKNEPSKAEISLRNKFRYDGKHNELITQMALDTINDQNFKQNKNSLIVVDGSTNVGTGIDDGILQVKKLLRDLSHDDLVNADFNLFGYSRGAISARVMTHIINEVLKEKTAKIPKISLIEYDPVPGPKFSFADSKEWTADKIRTLPSNVNSLVFLQRHEESVCFEYCLPDDVKGNTQIQFVDGHHMTMAGCVGYRDNKHSDKVPDSDKKELNKIHTEVIKRSKDFIKNSSCKFGLFPQDVNKLLIKKITDNGKFLTKIFNKGSRGRLNCDIFLKLTNHNFLSKIFRFIAGIIEFLARFFCRNKENVANEEKKYQPIGAELKPSASSTDKKLSQTEPASHNPVVRTSPILRAVFRQCQILSPDMKRNKCRRHS